MYTQRGQRLHRMCGVWSPLISDRLDAVTAGHLLYLWRFFFLWRTICLVRGSLSRGGPLICQQTICHCRDLMSPVKTSATRLFPTRIQRQFPFHRRKSHRLSIERNFSPLQKFLSLSYRSSSIELSNIARKEYYA